MRTNEEIMNDFDNLMGRLSPENLCCDGELSRTQVEEYAYALYKNKN